jgi:hypothetical protein
VEQTLDWLTQRLTQRFGPALDQRSDPSGGSPSDQPS